MRPSYLEAYKNGRLNAAAAAVSDILESCVLCPRQCRTNRKKGTLGYCKTASNPKVFSFMAHHGEEPPISGTRGSGTIFFSHCNLSCVYCQNYEFSQLGQGREMSPAELAEAMLKLQQEGCHNINLVTPTHVLAVILEALRLAIPAGLRIPLVYNSGGYESQDAIRLLSGIIDIYLLDMRYGNADAALKYSNAPDYPKYNQAAAKLMHQQVGTAEISPEGLIQKGLIIRHLVLPGNLSGTQKVMRFISEELSINTYISLMSQYLPYYLARNFPEINRRITAKEYQEAQEIMERYGLHNGWVQESYGLERFAGVHIKPFFRKDKADL